MNSVNGDVLTAGIYPFPFNMGEGNWSCFDFMIHNKKAKMFYAGNYQKKCRAFNILKRSIYLQDW